MRSTTGNEVTRVQLGWNETAQCCGCTLDLFEPETFPVVCSEPPTPTSVTHNARTRKDNKSALRLMLVFMALLSFPTQGAGAGQLRSLEEAVLLPLQDECQRRDRCTGPLCVSSVCQKGSVLLALV